MKNYKSCPICQGQNFEKSRTCKDYTVSHEAFDIVECKTCGFEFTNPIPLESEMGKYYQSEEYISHSNKKSDLTSKVYQFVRNWTIQKKISLIKRLTDNKQLLDIGSGTGEFLSQCKKHGFETTGIEPSEQARSYAISNYGLSVFDEQKLKELKDGNYDIITMWHVLEHVYHLEQRVNELNRLLKQNGVIIIAVPNRNSLDAKIYREHWAAYDVPRHLYHFRPKDMIHLFEKHGFKLKEIKGMKFDSFYVSLLSEKYKHGNSNYLRAIWTGFKSNVLAKNQKEKSSYSSQIYIFTKN